MRKILATIGVTALCVSATPAFAQIAQNPTACARLRSDMDIFVQDLVRRGMVPLNAALFAARQMVEIRRMTGDPCFMPPPPPAQAPGPPRIVHPQTVR
jgi:hypothetical protein